MPYSCINILTCFLLSPLGLNIGGTEAVCGLTAGRNYDYPKNALGGNLAPNIQACYAERDVVQLDVVLTAHHMGHFSYKACPIDAGEVASQDCFDSNPLTFVEDVLYGSLPDPDYPNRAYIPRADSALIQKDNGGDYKFSHRFKLPEGLLGELVLLQWHYITANSCMADEGYLNYNFPAGFEPNLQVGVCDFIPPDGRGVPEQVSRLGHYMYIDLFLSLSQTFIPLSTSLFSFGTVLKSEFLVIAQATPLRHLLLRLRPLLRQLRRLLQQLGQLQQLQHRQAYRLHHLRLLRAVLLKIMLVDQIILAPMECAAASGAIVVPQKDTAENAAKATAVDSHLLHLV